MSARKPVESGCTGSVTCALPGHVTSRRTKTRVTLAHARLTAGQYATLRERREAGKDTGR